MRELPLFGHLNGSGKRYVLRRLMNSIVYQHTLMERDPKGPVEKGTMFSEFLMSIMNPQQVGLLIRHVESFPSFKTWVNNPRDPHPVAANGDMDIPAVEYWQNPIDMVRKRVFNGFLGTGTITFVELAWPNMVSIVWDDSDKKPLKVSFGDAIQYLENYEEKEYRGGTGWTESDLEALRKMDATSDIHLRDQSGVVDLFHDAVNPDVEIRESPARLVNPELAEVFEHYGIKDMDTQVMATFAVNQMHGYMKMDYNKRYLQFMKNEGGELAVLYTDCRGPGDSQFVVTALRKNTDPEADVVAYVVDYAPQELEIVLNEAGLFTWFLGRAMWNYHMLENLHMQPVKTSSNVIFERQMAAHIRVHRHDDFVNYQGWKRRVGLIKDIHLARHTEYFYQPEYHMNGQGYQKFAPSFNGWRAWKDKKFVKILDTLGLLDPEDEDSFAGWLVGLYYAEKPIEVPQALSRPKRSRWNGEEFVDIDSDDDVEMMDTNFVEISDDDEVGDSQVTVYEPLIGKKRESVVPEQDYELQVSNYRPNTPDNLALLEDIPVQEAREAASASKDESRALSYSQDRLERVEFREAMALARLREKRQKLLRDSRKATLRAEREMLDRYASPNQQGDERNMLLLEDVYPDPDELPEYEVLRPKKPRIPLFEPVEVIELSD